MELFERIRRDGRDHGMSIHELARKYRVHRRTVRQALADATPPARKTPERQAPVLGPYRETVRGWLSGDRTAPPKQRHTARRIWQRLAAEQGVRVAESSVRKLVRELKDELGIDRREVMVAQVHLPAAEAEVDFGQFTANIAGQEVRVHMFVLRLSHSGKAVHIAYGNEAQESFLDGHVTAFDRLGGVPGRIRYDNLKPAVTRVLLGREREENTRFIALRGHFGYDSFFCEPGIKGAHEKGGVEGEVGRFRRAHLVPVPKVATIAELNELMAAADAAEDARHITGRSATVGQDFAVEVPLLAALPVGDFDPARSLTCRADDKSRVCVRQSYYSVPVGYAGRLLRVALGARQVRVFAEGGLVASHPRSLHKYSQDLLLDHYLEVLVGKPGALPGSIALARARDSGVFTTLHERFWKAARRELGDSGGTRALIAVLLLHRSLPDPAVLAGIGAALDIGSLDADVIAVEARRHLDKDRATPPVQPPPAHQESTGTTAAAATTATTATTAAAAMAGFHRSMPILTLYNQLLTYRSAP